VLPTQHLSLTALTIILTVSGALFYGAIVLYGTWIDGRRQDIRKQGLHPVTDPDGHVHAREEEQQQHGSNRD
jgi:hypothetical protein